MTIGPTERKPFVTFRRTSAVHQREGQQMLALTFGVLQCTASGLDTPRMWRNRGGRCHRTDISF